MPENSTQENLLLKLNNVCKSVNTGSEQLDILQGIQLEIKQGESVAIVGASGSGKSTMLGIMAGLDESSSGEVYLLGEALHQLNEDQRSSVRAKGVGFVFQSFQLLPGLTAYENVSLPIEMSGRYNARQTEEKTLDWLDKVGLSHRIHHYPKQLSGGEQQRVAIARAFSSEPKILFADEPTGNLDSNTGQQIVEQLFSLNSQLGTTLVLVTHDEQLAKRCARTVRMSDGQVKELNA
ncbi:MULTISPECIES: ABC transporter ATP-binding protein [unclassified Oleiphilus]|nr:MULTISPECIES: ABC transporter ATP-binding protein [unclassified Oleiphilus]KZY46048.1 ABC transporter [Oleiphilus sp. HI0050]KZY88700.1 ABC transporter [Oleiphilus sp. HI0072]KZZ29916.1 ABC transporter [Oleiphilus sp. HI0081]KZY37840.1 ABC transporter [Oleiphilus sp. HI0043]KZY59984.1 ABC transporter [Oleiphilus sp. HI0061]